MIKVLILILSIIFFLVTFFLSNKWGKKIVRLNYFLILIILTILISLFFINKDTKIQKYIAPSYDGEKIIPGYFDEENS